MLSGVTTVEPPQVQLDCPQRVLPVAITGTASHGGRLGIADPVRHAGPHEGQ